MKNIAVFFGGKSCESDISVITALGMYNAIKYDYNAVLVYLYNGKYYIGKRLNNAKNYHPFRENKYTEVCFKRGYMHPKGLKSKKKIDCALICCHGGQGEGGSLSGYLDIAEIPYTCCSPLQSSLCMDKAFTKYLLRYFHLPTLPFTVYHKGDDVNKTTNVEYPVILKPALLGSSIGISIVKDFSEMQSKLEKAYLFGEKVLMEKALTDFREFTCAVFKKGNELICGDIEEVVSPEHFYSFEEKYEKGETKREYPAKIEPDMEDSICRICKKIYNGFEMKGVIRVDFLAQNGKLYVNEINTIPGSLAWYLFKSKGYDAALLCRDLIEEAIVAKEKQQSFFTVFESNVLSCFPFDGKMISKS